MDGLAIEHSMTTRDRTFGGRVRPKKNEPTSWADLVELANHRMAFIYQRLSSHEQVKRSIYSLKAQDALADIAREDGYPDDLIYVGKRDLGISGTKGQEDRPELAYLVDRVEADAVESVYVVHISRLYRDQTLIHALTLGELFKERGVIIVTPQMRLNLRDKMHMRLYRMEVERAADELEIMAHRLIAARDLKARAGGYGGEGLPPGYIVDQPRIAQRDQGDLGHTAYQVYEPHAKVVRTIFERLVSGMTPTHVARWCRRRGVVFPFFPPGLDTGANLKTFVKTKSNESGWLITTGRVRSIARNPAYIGWRVWSGEVIDEQTFPPLVDKETFWRVQGKFSKGRKIHPRGDVDPLPLVGLLYCGHHNVPRRMTTSSRTPRSRSLYRCTEPDLQETCVSITTGILDVPIGEAVVSQVALPRLAEKVLSKLVDEYEQAKEQAAIHRREMRRVEAEVENLRGNLARGILSTEQLQWIDDQVAQRLTRIQELADLESRPVGEGTVTVIPGEAEVQLVLSFLEDLDQTWETQPDALKNAFLRLLLDRVVIHPSADKVRVTLCWRVGLEQKLLIRRPGSGISQAWSEAELRTMSEHYEASGLRDLMEMLPGRSWRAINTQGKRLGLSRAAFAGNPGQRAGERYTLEEDDLVRQYYAGAIDLEEVLSTGRSFSSIRRRATHLGLKRGITWKWLEINQRNCASDSRSRPGAGRHARLSLDRSRE